MDNKSVENIREYNELVREGINLAKNLRDEKTESAIRDLESKQNYEAIKRLVSDLREEYKGIASDSTYIAEAYKRLVQDISKSNVGLSTARSALSKLSDIARDITIHQKDVGSLSKKQLDNYRTQLVTQRKNLEISYGLVNSIRDQEVLANVIKGEIGEETILYHDLLKSIKIQEERLKSINSIMGVAGNTIHFIKEGMDKVGLGGLASMLKFDDALEKAKEKADELSEVTLTTQIIDLRKQKDEIKNIGKTINEEYNEKLKEVFEQNLSTKELNEKIAEILKEKGEKLKAQESSYAKINEEILKAEENLSKGMFSKRWEVLKTTIKEVGKGFKELINDPTALWGVIITKVLSGFLELNKASVEFQRLTGDTANLWDASINLGVITSVDYIRELSNLTKQFGVNAQTAFSQVNIVEMAEMTQLMGMSADQAGIFARMAQTSNRSLSDMNESMVEAVNNFNSANNIAVNHRQVIDDISKTSSALQLSLGQNPTSLARAAAEARRLGLELSTLENMASSLLDFESSIASQLEAELLTGKQLNIEKARYYALMNDMEGVAKELNNNQEMFNSYVTGNRIQQEAIAKSMGMSREQMGEMIMQSKLYGNLTEEQRAQAMGMTVNDLKRLEIQQSLNKSIEKMAEALAGPLEILARMLDQLL
jgi:ribosomal protein S17E